MAHQVSAQQLGRLACLYVRQSTLQQVVAHGESTTRQMYGRANFDLLRHRVLYRPVG
jgi:hypothetical protein